MEAGIAQEIRRNLERAVEALGVAQHLRESGHYPDAVSKTYYAMFYAATAALLTLDIRVSRHSAVIAAIGENLSKTRLIDPKHHRAFIDAFEERENADYNVFAVYESGEVDRRLSEAREFVEEMRRFIRGKSFLA